LEVIDQRKWKGWKRRQREVIRAMEKAWAGRGRGEEQNTLGFSLSKELGETLTKGS